MQGYKPDVITLLTEEEAKKQGYRKEKEKERKKTKERKKESEGSHHPYGSAAWMMGLIGWVQ